MNIYRVTTRTSCPVSQLGEFSEHFPGCKALSASAVYETVFEAESDEKAIKVAEIISETAEADNIELSQGEVVQGVFFAYKAIYRLPKPA